MQRTGYSEEQIICILTEHVSFDGPHRSMPLGRLRPAKGRKRRFFRLRIGRKANIIAIVSLQSGGQMQRLRLFKRLK